MKEIIEFLRLHPQGSVKFFKREGAIYVMAKDGNLDRAQERAAVHRIDEGSLSNLKCPEDWFVHALHSIIDSCPAHESHPHH